MHKRSARGLQGIAVGVLVLSTIVLGQRAATAATVCVSTAAALASALLTAESNGADDVIQVVQGTYQGSFLYSSTERFSVTMRGGYTAGCAARVVDPPNTVLDAMRGGTVLVLASSANADFVLDGLTLQNGSRPGDGGGLFLSTNGGNVTLSNNVVSQNTANGNGGGLFLSMTGGTLRLSNTRLSQNTAAGVGGAYIYSRGTTTLTNNTIRDNAVSGAYASLGGLFVVGVTVRLHQNTIIGNDGGDHVGGAEVHGVIIDLTDNTISHNSAGTIGALYFISASDGESVFTLTGNTISHNIGRGAWGGVVFTSFVPTSVTLTNNVISNNAAIDEELRTGGPGGGLGLDGLHQAHLLQRLTMTNNTITGNRAFTEGGGVWLRLWKEDVRAHMYNNIIWGNQAAQGADLWLDNDGDGDRLRSPVNLFNNDLDQSAAGTFITVPFVIDPSNLNNVDPLFVDAVHDDYHVQAGSPVIDRGANNAPGRPATDKDGKPRIIGGTVDLGAFEFGAGECVPEIEVEPLLVNFGSVRLGTTKVKKVHIRNNGCAELRVDTIEDLASPFRLERPQPPFTVAPHQEAEVGVELYAHGGRESAADHRHPQQ